MADFLKEDIEMLMDGVLPWPAVQEMMRDAKDTDRFDKYIEILQERVEFKDPILLPLTPALFIVARNKDRVVKCRCGYDFGDYRINWKVSSLIYVRDTKESIAEVFQGREAPDPKWCQIREYICPGCGTQLEVEAVPRGCPPDFDFLPDLDTFYDEWLGRPLRKRFEFKDKTLGEVSQWEERTYNKPIPQLEGMTKQFYRYCRKEQLRFQRCKDCGTWRHVPREMCPECGSFRWRWERSSGMGTIFSWTVAERALHPQFYDETPYAPTVVEMDEGVRILTEIVDCEPEDLEIGARVEVVFDEVTNKVTLPKFKLSTSTKGRRNGRDREARGAKTNGQKSGRSDREERRSEFRSRPGRGATARRRSIDLPANIHYDKNDHVALVTIDRPEAMNALTKDMLAGIDNAFEDFNADDDLWVAILTGAGTRAFCTGMDLKEAIPLLTNGDELGYEDHTKRQFSDVYKPIIAAINGPCIAGGLEMVAGTDLRVAADTATFGLGEVRWGLVPAGGSHVRLPRQIPWTSAMELLLTGETISAQRAYEIGLVNRVVPSDQLMATAVELAQAICKNGPLAVRTSKEIAVKALDLEPDFVLEKDLAKKVFASDDAKEGPKAFAEKRKPNFTGR